MPDSNHTEIDALLKQATPEAAAQLQDISETASDKDTRKAAKRALYLLSQKHILPPERTSRPAGNIEDQKSKTETPDALRAFASAFDGAGNRLLIFLVPQAYGGNPLLTNILINDEIGVRNYGGKRLPRREIETQIAEMQSGMERGLVIAEIEPDYGRFLLSEARAINQQRGTMTPAGFLELLPLVGSPRQEYEQPAVYETVSAEEILADTSLSHDAQKLFDATWFEPWFLDVEAATPWLYRLMQELESPIELPESAKLERREKVISEAAEALLTPRVRGLYVRRLEETADVLRRRGETETAHTALYHALQLAQEKPVADVPFARALVDRSIGAAYFMLREEAERRSGARASSDGEDSEG